MMIFLDLKNLHAFKMVEVQSFLLFCSASNLVNSLLKVHQNLEKISFSMLLYSNVCGLCQASGELCQVCVEFHPSAVCLKPTFVATLLMIFVLLVMLWGLDDTGLNMVMVCSF